MFRIALDLGHASLDGALGTLATLPGGSGKIDGDVRRRLALESRRVDAPLGIALQENVVNWRERLIVLIG